MVLQAQGEAKRGRSRTRTRTTGDIRLPTGGIPWFTVACCIGALGPAFFPLSGFRSSLLIPAMGAGLVGCAYAQRGRVAITDWRKYAAALDPWMTMGVCAAIGITWLGYGALQAWVWLIIGALTVASLQITAIARYGSAAWDLLVESVLAIGALSSVLWAFRWGTGQFGTDAVLVWITICQLLLAGLLFIWMVSIDRDVRNISGAFLGVALFGLLIMAIVAFRITLGHSHTTELRSWLGIIVISAAGIGAAHYTAPEIRSHAVRVVKVSAARRALITLGSVLFGPILTVGGFTGDWPLNISFIATASALLSAGACVHVFNLMRRWGALEHDVEHDSLTGLPNRRSFHDSLDRALGAARSRSSNVAVMFLDLDRFKNINDSLGHAAGNEMLVETARRLRRAAPEEAVVARLAGDEFAILLPNTAGPAISRDEANKLLATFGEPFSIGRRSIYVTPSIGIAHYPRDGAEAGLLLQRADAAMYRAKQRGRNTVELFSNDVSKGAVTRLDIESALHSAVKEQQLQLFYQPKIDMNEGHVHSVEALLRWRHPVLGVVGPDQFVPVAEETGLIDEIGLWALIEGCKQAKEWSDQGYFVPVAVNVSPKQFEHHDIADLVARVLRMTRLSSDLLELELTESIALQDPDRVRSVLRDLEAMGVHRAIDDFGVGYSGLSYLNTYPFNTIKIDRKFVQSIGDNGAPIIDAIIAMGHGLRLEIVAEGVETRAQVDYLRERGCHLMQGFYFSAPLTKRQFDLKLLKRARRRPKPKKDPDSVPQPSRMVSGIVTPEGTPNDELIRRISDLIDDRRLAS